MAQFTTLYSSSSGNSAVIEEDGKFLLVDMGKNCKQTVLALKNIGLLPNDLSAILITHEHTDHISGLKVFLKNYPVPIYTGADTKQELLRKNALPEDAIVHILDIDDTSYNIDDFSVRAFSTSHDSVGCYGFQITTPKGKQMAIATDLGEVGDTVMEYFKGSSLVALESNYDRVMLQMGRYPQSLKNRISSSTGHLSNQESAQVIGELTLQGVKSFALCHVSQENNMRAIVREEIEKQLEEKGLKIDEDCFVQVQQKHTPSPWIVF